MVNVQQSRARLPTPPRDRRGLLAVLALLLIVVGALSAAIVVYRTGNRADVLVAARPISAGQKVTSGDFTTTRVAADSRSIVPASAEPNFVGSYATTGIPSGSLINARMFRVKGVVPPGSVVLGLTLTVDQRPAATPQSGDIVRVFFGPKSSGNGSGTATTNGSTAATNGSSATAPTQLPVGYVIVPATRIVDVALASATSSSAVVTISVLLTSDDATALIDYAASDEVAVGSLPVDTKLPIDFVTG